MAVTKIHPIKSTLKKALDYIENPDKTDGKLFVSSYGCSYETADIEFQMLLDQAYQKGNNLAHHLIQAFEPGETTAEQAHEIGRQLADEVLQGKYPYVITTHIDKGHLHNHIIFCAVDMANQRKYISNRQSYAFIRRTSDRLCKEYGLSVVKPGKDKGKTYAEWDAQKKGKSWKAKLKIAIDAAIPQAKDFDSFLRRAGRRPPSRTGTLHPLQDLGGGLHRGTDHPADQGHCHRPGAAQKKRRGNLPADRLGGQYQGPAVGGLCTVGEAAQLEAGRQFLKLHHRTPDRQLRGLGKQAGRDQRGKRRGSLRLERRRTPPWGYGAADKKPLRLQAAPACGAGTAKCQRQGRVPAAA